MKGIEVFGFTTLAVESPSATVVCVHRRILAHRSHGDKRKSIVVVIPLEALMLDLVEAFTAKDMLFLCR